MRHLINENGAPFDALELQTITLELDALTEKDRIEYRNKNASEIAQNSSQKILIVSGPGTGKSFLFRDRIDYWFRNQQDTRVLVTSFVKKLVADLGNDISNDQNLTDEQKKQTTVSTLHSFARSIVEKNHGTSKWQFKPYIRIIGQFWKEKVWGDVLTHHNQLDANIYSWQNFEEQLHNDDFRQSVEWNQLKRIFFELCKFYYAVGFADLIIRARIALEENDQLNEYDFFIIDEYQDFNRSEDGLIRELVKKSKGLLIVGDDDQVLYEKLKCGKAELIRNHYKNKDMAKAMLPFSTRNSYHIAKSAMHFIQQNADAEHIKKIYLPLNTDQQVPKVQIIGCATPTTAFDYIEQFVKEHKHEIDDRKEKLSKSEEKDPFLLILTPSKEINYYQSAKGKRKKSAKEKLFELASAYKDECQAFSEDYYKVVNYYSVAKNPKNNFAFRKILFYENVSQKNIHALILKAIQNDRNFCDLEDETVKDIISKCETLRNIIEDNTSIDVKISALSKLILITNNVTLKSDLEEKILNQQTISQLEEEEEDKAELDELEAKKACAVELITIVGSKGLSADHVIVIGFDNINMKWVPKNAFYVAMTRARKSIHLITALKSGGCTEPHEFINQLPESHTEFYKYKKERHSKEPLNSKTEFLYYLKKLIWTATRAIITHETGHSVVP